MVNGGNIFARQKRCTFRPRRMGLFLVTRFGEINLRIGIHILDFLYLLIYFYKLGIILLVMLCIILCLSYSRCESTFENKNFQYHYLYFS